MSSSQSAEKMFSSGMPTPDSKKEDSSDGCRWNIPTLSRGATFCCQEKWPISEIATESDKFNQVSNGEETCFSVNALSIASSQFDSDLEDEKVEGTIDQFGMAVYEETCLCLGILPIRSVLEGLQTDELYVRYRSMTDNDTKALCNALQVNRCVRSVYLDGNGIGNKGAEYLAELLLDNVTITKLHLSNNCLGSAGIELLLDGMLKNRVVSSLNLSGNKTSDINATSIGRLIELSKTLFRLNLSYSQLTDDACKILGPFIAVNDTMRMLDLSWNHIQTKGAIELFKGVKENILLKKFRISMNGLADGGAIALAQCLLKNTSLTEVDISHNRISNNGALHISKVLQVTLSLKKLIMHDNPVTADGLMYLLSALKKTPETSMIYFDISPVPVHLKADEVLVQLRKKHAALVVKHGTKIKYRVSLKTYDTASIQLRDPLAILKDYICSKGYRLIDFFKQFDKDGSGAIDKKEFLAGIKSIDVPLSMNQLEVLISRLDKDGDGEIDFRELYQADKELRIKKRKAKTLTGSSPMDS